MFASLTDAFGLQFNFKRSVARTLWVMAIFASLFGADSHSGSVFINSGVHFFFVLSGRRLARR